ncbi:Microtubule-associated protein, MAP65/ASE1-type [Metarhizium album ARSEF 1941]|uniref:Microtubule-associated protein, MAP65/ASE1-type n=1 Tax=Metarhizium album (strain ARSEF 1941) TaxID=1081103 RepID=A0A0B2WW08_METAS|nr:Microtubule-associated protein, MAP65/ASE1-type [Metarhizium album ARSEF 1941]KHN97637.1 Microtubule-associated protein, MAP65/ASE1-type [Metarhizium album ARSEF 1941]
MDTSYLAQQVNGSIAQLSDLFDEIGVPNHEREARESELFTALSEALNNQVRLVTTEKKEMVDEAKKIITTIRQMEASLDDSKPRRGEYQEDDEFRITYPLNRCLQGLREKHIQISRLHKERFEQVKTLVEALESYSSHLEPTFVQIALPPTGPNQSLPPTFDISNTYVEKLDAEFTRVYDEYMRRVASVQAFSNQIIQLWAELGTPQAQQDSAIVKYYRDAPEQLGLHQEDLNRLQTKRDRLSEEKKNLEKRLKDLKSAVEALWLKLGVHEGETRAFLNQNRGCGVRQINEFEDELARLNELKRENLHLFVEDSRVKLQELWDSLYFSEDEMLEFTPAFSDVYSDALLEAHEREVARLEALKEQRAPILAVVDRHKSLIKDRDDLAASSQDASRLMMRGQKGEKRDPGKLLREEKMRKRIAKELPKVSAEVRKMLESWEAEYGRPFLVFGERYLDELEPEEPKRAGPASRCKTPAKAPPSTVKKSAGLARAQSAKAAPPRSMTKTPTAGGRTVTKKMQSPGKTHAMHGRESPSRIPARVPLSNLRTGGNSPERASRPESRGETLRNGAPVRAPPPKMRDLKAVPQLQTPRNPYRGTGIESSIVRQVEPEDVYGDRPQTCRGTRSNSNLSNHAQPRYCEDVYDDGYDGRCATIRAPRSAYPQAAPSRQTSNNSHTSTAMSGSENWETYDDNSEPEVDVSEDYYSKLLAARGKRYEPEQGCRPASSQAKRLRGMPGTPYAAAPVVLDHDGDRIISGSEWTDEDVF